MNNDTSGAVCFSGLSVDVNSDRVLILHSVDCETSSDKGGHNTSIMSKCFFPSLCNFLFTTDKTIHHFLTFCKKKEYIKTEHFAGDHHGYLVSQH